MTLRLAAQAAVVCLCTGSACAIEVSSQYFSPWNASRPNRESTSYIILHTTEAATEGSIRSLSRQGEAHYLVDPAGRIYRIIDKRKVAAHAGRSLWDGRTNLDNHSLGIEVVGYHNRDITPAQYESVKNLLNYLKALFKVPDERVLTHSMIAYSTPNKWFNRSHRGRKRCGMLFATTNVRQKLGLNSKPAYDPDVREGRVIVGDPYLSRVLYGNVQMTEAPEESPTSVWSGKDNTVITKGKTAKGVAGEKYNTAEVLYVFPGGRERRGDEITDWSKIPVGTKVVFGVDQSSDADEAVREVKEANTPALDVAGSEYNKNTTIYFFRDGAILRGNEVAEEDLQRLPKGTLVLVGYIYGGKVTAKKSAFDLLGKKWNYAATFYRFPDGSVKAGNTVDQAAIPRNTLVFYSN